MPKQSALQIALAVFVIAGFIAGDYAVRLYFENKARSHPSVLENPALETGFIDRAGQPLGPSAGDVRNFPSLASDSQRELNQVLDDAARLAFGEPNDPADDRRNDETGTRGSEPRPLTPPVNAAPIKKKHANTDSFRRSVIEDGLPNATPQERNIWFEELKQLDPESIRDILKVREELKVRFRLDDLIGSDSAGKPNSAGTRGE